MTNKTKAIIGIVGGVVVLGSVGAAMGGNDDNGTSSTSSSSSIVSTVSSEQSSTVSDVSTNSNDKQEEIPEPRETAIGKSDKSVDGIMTIKATSVNNDKMGNWRYSGFSESGLDMSEYALSYYKEYFKSDKEIHAIVNFADKTTTRISCTSGILYVTVMEYVDGEEHDADLMFTGDIINDYIVYTDNGDIEDITADEEDSSSQSSEVASEPPQSSTETTPQSSEPPAETPQSSTVSNAEPSKSNVVYIAASGDGKKYHKSPYCSGMDGNVIEMTREEAEANGYTVCKKNSCK